MVRVRRLRAATSAALDGEFAEDPARRLIVRPGKACAATSVSSPVVDDGAGNQPAVHATHAGKRGVARVSGFGASENLSVVGFRGVEEGEHQ